MCSWKRILWKKQGYPDNFVGDDFLRLEKKYAIVNRLDAFYGSILVTQEISSCFGLTIAFWGLAEGRISSTTVILISSCLCFLLYFVVRFKKFWFNGREMIADTFGEAKVVIFALILIWCSSPLIKSLTESVATDTIHACTTALFFLHLLLYPYGASVAIVNPTISHNLGLFASVCLASRLSSNEDVFALIILAVIFFTLLPGFKRHCQVHFGRKSVVIMTLNLLVASFIGGYFWNPNLCPLLAAIVVLSNIIAPCLFLFLQPHRENFYGPWDEALITEKFS